MSKIYKSSRKGFPGGFTVLMAVYHKEDPYRFKQALESIFSNTLLPDQVILVVDGPVPEYLDNIITDTEQRSELFSVYRLSQNRGLAEALNMGLAYVETEWVVRADSDDINKFDRFEKQAAAIADISSSVDIIGGAIREIDYDGTPLAIRRTVENDSDIRDFVRRRNPFNHMTVAFRLDIVRKVGGYPNIFLKEDYALWALLIHAGARCMNLPDVLVDATTGREMYGRRGGLKYAMAEVELQRHLVSLNIKSLSHAVFDGIARSIVFLMPPFFRALVYKRLLRS
ncbi:amylovoran biosynthesis protein AmsE [Prosthecochloris sp. ZM]|uniref:glycosyltransferase n=1 Tax=Prosthecochloris sp. ZM TaxID=2283143 RepID=UPI000DF7FACB|nr:glycosyltransferase [Prosthecochloris sp. ZM]RDD29687.1 amylovoran biosynthesis protein AmsE [Prosthecochloris sp. ZM]